MPDLKRPELWEELEARCRVLGYGKLGLEVIVVDGVAKRLDVCVIKESLEGKPRVPIAFKGSMESRPPVRPKPQEWT